MTLTCVPIVLLLSMNRKLIVLVKSLSDILTLFKEQHSKSNNLCDNTFPDSVNTLHSETNQPVNPDNI